MFYVRKLAKPPNLQKIQTTTEITIVPADFVGQEMRTSQNTLSVWRCESLDEAGRHDAIVAALFASSEIVATQFIILDSEMLEAAGIKTCDSEGITAYKGLNHLHTDLCELTYEKIGKLLSLYHEASCIKDRTPKIEKKEFQQIALDAYRSNCLDESIMQDHFQKAIQKLIANSEAS